MTKGESDGGTWDDFVREFEKENGAAKPSSADRPGQTEQPEQRRSRRHIVLPLAAALLVVAGVSAYTLTKADPDPAPAAAPAPAPSVSAQPAAAAPAASNSPSEKALSGVPDSAIPMSVFPAQVEGYTLLSGVTQPSCTSAESVGPSLAGLITQGQGCVGVDFALYRDAEGNQYNLALFTMKDQMDSIHIINVLAVHPESYQAGVQVPAKDSGLRVLPEKSPFVEGFSSLGHGMLLGKGQWSDGRGTDFDKLQGKLTALTAAVMKNVPV
ncbi:hypothetical protein ACIBCA_16705 [Kitasatospora sp. NPDC051170]|uniref:hypothetical protein n=1 Tax=Kitasatospora sp. NPDC051170 TaxID=3364056 RepID=UPI00379B13AC